jgi:hypothetical protein
MVQATQLAGGSLSTMVMGLAASLLALAVFVQVVQEIYKFLTSSKSRAYSNALQDYLGPWSTSLLREGLLSDLKVRGPFQINSRSPRKWLLPMPAESLKAALEATAPPWCQRVLQALNLEASLGTEGGPTSPNWKILITDLEAAAHTDAPGNGTAKELLEFLKRWTEDPQVKLDVSATLTAFRARFLPHVDAAVKGFPQLMRQFDFTYRRRNLRQTFLLGLLVAFLGGFPIGVLYQRASRMTPDEARALAQAATSLADSVALRAQATVAPDSTNPGATVTSPDSLTQASQQLDQALRDARTALTLVQSDASGDALSLSSLRRFVEMPWPKKGEYLFGCLVTALLLSFGAPFWNDLTKSLMTIQQQRDQPMQATGAVSNS